MVYFDMQNAHRFVWSSSLLLLLLLHWLWLLAHASIEKSSAALTWLLANAQKQAEYHKEQVKSRLFQTFLPFPHSLHSFL
jgi:type IV secretory pathway VirB3-like protein